MYGKIAGQFAVSGFEGKPLAEASRSEVIVMPQIMKEYDATTLVGLKTIVHDAAVLDEAEDTIELPKLDELMATAAIARALLPVRLRGPEMKAMRKIMGYTLADLAGRLDEKTAVETVSRWESEAQPMGGYAEKLFRLLVCETLKVRAPGISYDGSMIANLKVVDPWMTDPEYDVPAVQFSLLRMKESGVIRDAWGEQNRAA